MIFPSAFNLVEQQNNFHRANQTKMAMPSKTFVDGNRCEKPLPVSISLSVVRPATSRTVWVAIAVSRSKRGSTFLSDFMHTLVIDIRLPPAAHKTTDWRDFHGHHLLDDQVWACCLGAGTTTRQGSEQATGAPSETEAPVRNFAFRECACRPDAWSARPKSRMRAQLGRAACVAAYTCKSVTSKLQDCAKIVFELQHQKPGLHTLPLPNTPEHRAHAAETS